MTKGSYWIERNNMKKQLTILILLFSVSSLGQSTLDTIKVYNVHCSYSEGNSHTSWGGNWTEFYPTEKCPSDSIATYIENYSKVSLYMKNRTFFWIKLYNTHNQLIYEGLKYSDCKIGKFICYWPNGNIKVIGEYDGYSYSNKKGYVLKKCAGKKKGTWVYYDENGIQTDIVKF